MRWRENLGATAVNSVAQSLLALPAAAAPISEEVFFERIYDEDRDRVRRSFDHYLQSRSLQSKEIHMRVVAAETGAVKKLNCVLSSIVAGAWRHFTLCWCRPSLSVFL
jgi:hypothetical protein